MQLDVEKEDCEKKVSRYGNADKKNKAVFSSEIFGGNIPVALSLLFGKIYPTMN
jgi:uncharacterized membrane protein SpoIIM required for sporulation